LLFLVLSANVAIGILVHWLQEVTEHRSFCVNRTKTTVEICAVLGFYAAQNGSVVLTFQDNLLVHVQGSSSPRRTFGYRYLCCNV